MIPSILLLHMSGITISVMCLDFGCVNQKISARPFGIFIHDSFTVLRQKENTTKCVTLLARFDLEKHVAAD